MFCSDKQNFDEAKILIVDDSALQARQLKDFLEKDGFSVSICGDAVEAMTHLQGNIPDLIISDIIMPKVDGYELCRYIQDSKHLQDIPVMMITGKSNLDKLKKSFAEGAMDFISKPIQEIELHARVRSLLRLKFEMARRKQHEQELVKLTNRLKEKNQILERLSHIDSLTGIANRRYFEEVFAKEWKQAIRSKTNFSMLLADVDFFKSFNDTYGHQAGDQCLKQIVASLESALKRPNDFIARYGGEEFIVLLPDTSNKGSQKLAELMREKVIDLAIPHEKSDVCEWVTISIGIASILPTMSNDSSDLITYADKALYSAKKSGRNRVMWPPQKELAPLYYD